MEYFLLFDILCVSKKPDDKGGDSNYIKRVPPLCFLIYMHYLYVLKSLKEESLYIGQTSDLKRRFKEHNNGENTSTKYRKPFELVYYEAYKSKKDAIQRENKLKQFKNSYSHLKNRIENSLE